jgi:hypothetical protein
MPLQKARRPGPHGVRYRQQYVRCGKERCKQCPPAGPGHGPYWYGFYWDYRQRTKSFYVGKVLPPGAELIQEPTERLSDAAPAAPDASEEVIP